MWIEDEAFLACLASIGLPRIVVVAVPMCVNFSGGRAPFHMPAGARPAIRLTAVVAGAEGAGLRIETAGKHSQTAGVFVLAALKAGTPHCKPMSLGMAAWHLLYGASGGLCEGEQLGGCGWC